MKFQTALRLKLENFLLWSWTLGIFNSLILRLDWEIGKGVGGGGGGRLACEQGLLLPSLGEGLGGVGQ